VFILEAHKYFDKNDRHAIYTCNDTSIQTHTSAMKVM
jgi:hypothetical protein